MNGKGGAGKTPSTVLLSAVFARYGGAGVLAWDNNQTRGTLGWRTEQGPHESTLLELLPQVDRLLSTSAQSADLAHYVHHQTRDRFDVLRSKPMALAQEQRVEPEDVDAIHAVASKYYRLIFIDSGNDESDPMWRRMIDHADQLVVATTTRDDHAEAGALLLEALADRDERSARLASNAVVIVSQADPKATPADMQRVATGYRDLSREAGALARQAGTGIIVTDNRDMIADLFYTLRDEPFRIYARPPEGFPDSYYEQEFALPADTAEKILFVTTRPLECAAEPPEVLKSWKPFAGYYEGRTIYAYKVSSACVLPRS